jgi:hypothetical protein
VILTAHLKVFVPVSDATVTLDDRSVDVSLTNSPFGLMGESLDDDAIVIEWNGGIHACPRTPRLRALEGVLAIRRAYGALGGATVIPDSLARAARDELEEMQKHSPGVRSHILTSPWHVPARWFVPFHPEEREVVETTEGPVIRYRAAYAAAAARVNGALEALEGVDLPESVVGELDELGAWLAEFDGASVVELDYGSVSRMFAPEDIRQDDSVENVQRALDAVRSRDWETVAEHYGAVAYRWTPAMAVAYSS